MGEAGKLVGKVRNAHTPGDLWHLSIDDLFKPPGENTEPAGPGPFVLNLSTSTATLPAPPARMPRFTGLRVYQLQQRSQDGGRVQFQLRLGIIQSALEADAILERVREHYPGATLETIGAEDKAAFAEAQAAEVATERGASTDAAPRPAAQAKSPDASRTTNSKSQSAAAAAGGALATKPPTSVLPDVPPEPAGSIRWDIDELLPDLPVTRPSKSNPSPSSSAAAPSGANARKAKLPEPSLPAREARSSTQGPAAPPRGANSRKGAAAHARSPSAPHSPADTSNAAHSRTAARATSATSSARSSAPSHAPTSNPTARAAAAPSKPATPPKAPARPPRKPSRDSLEATVDISATTAEITLEICLPALERTQEITPIEVSPPAPEAAPTPRAKRAREADARPARREPDASAALPEFTLDIDEVLGGLSGTTPPDSKPVMPNLHAEPLTLAPVSERAVASQQLADAVRDLEAFAPPVVEPPRAETPQPVAAAIRDTAPPAAPDTEPARVEAPQPVIDAMRDIPAPPASVAKAARTEAAPLALDDEALPQIDAVRGAPLTVESGEEKQPEVAEDIPRVDTPVREAATIEAPPLADAAVDALLSASIGPEPPSPQLESRAPEGSPPASPATEPTVDDGNFDYDSNADTVEVEALVMIDAPLDLGDEPPASAPAELASEQPPLLSAALASENEVVFELDYLDPAVLETTPKVARAPALDADADGETQSSALVAEPIALSLVAEEPTAPASEERRNSAEPAGELTDDAAALAIEPAIDEASPFAALLASEPPMAVAEPAAIADAAGSADLPAIADAPAIAELAAIADVPTIAELAAIAEAEASAEPAASAEAAAGAELAAIAELDADQPVTDTAAAASEIESLPVADGELTPAAIAQALDSVADDSGVGGPPAIALDALPVAQPLVDAPVAEAQGPANRIEHEVPAEPATTRSAAPVDAEAPIADVPVVAEASIANTPTVAEAAVADLPIAAETRVANTPVVAEAPVTDASTTADLDDGSVTIEAPVFWNDTPPVIEVTTGSAERELGPDSLTVEAPSAWRDTPTAATGAHATAERELGPDSMTIEAPVFWKDTSPAAATGAHAAAERELGPDSLTIEAPAFWKDLPAADATRERSHASSVTLEVLTLSAEPLLLPPLSDESGSATEAHEMAALAAQIAAQLADDSLPEPLKPEAAESAPPLTLALDDAPASLPESPIATPPQPELALMADAAELAVPSSSAAAPAEPFRKEDSQTLEVLVAKIGALIETAQAHDADGPAAKASEQNAVNTSASHAVELPALHLLADDASSSAPAAAQSPPTVVAPAPPTSIESAESAPIAAPIPESPAPSLTPTAVASAATEPLTAAAAQSSAVTPRAAIPAAPRSPAKSMWPVPAQAKEPGRARPSHTKAAPSRTQHRSSPTPPPARTTTAATPPASTLPPPAAATFAAPRTRSNVITEPETPAFDSTQTVRALTPLELNDGEASKSYAIQLLLAEDPILPEHIPNLDIFEAYRLYVVTGLFEDRVMHALRLGFFSSDVAAEAVAGYLKSYFERPDIKRVSSAEHDRFQERRVAARKDVGATGTHKSIELASRPPLPERRAKVEVTAAKQSTPSLWSRLLKR